MLRAQISDALKDAMRAKDERATSTMRLILAALKDRDIAARGKGNEGEIGDDELLQLLQSMIKQRRDSIEAYTKGGRQDLADGEAEEITFIEKFLPEQMNEEEIAAAVDEVIAANPGEVEGYRGGKTKLMGFFVGQVMKATQGKANPQAVQKMLRESRLINTI